MFGDALGFAQFVQLNPAAGDHPYVYGPVPPDAVGAPPIFVLLPLQMEVVVPAFAVGLGFTKTVDVLVEVLELASVTVTVYAVVVAGDAVGFAQFVQLNPAAGPHE